MLPILPLLSKFGLGALTGLWDFLKKYWPYVLFVAVLFYIMHWYGEKRYNEGFSTAAVEYEKATADALQSKVEELRKQKELYEGQIKKAQTTTADAQKAKEKAEADARKFREKAGSYYAQLEKLKHEITITGPDGPHNFTHSFVGLYNLAVRLPEGDQGVSGTASGNADNGPQVGLPEIAEAAGLERGASANDLAGQSTVDEFDLLYNAQYNYRIANTCIAERKLINEYFNKLCELGYCEQ